MQRKLITLLITGTVFTAGLIMGFGGYVFAGDPVPDMNITIEQIPGGRVSSKNYNSALSNTKSIGQVRMEVGDILLRYGVGGADINKVTDALEGNGVYEAELEWFLIAIGINDGATSGAYGGGAGAGKVKAILLEFDKLGISKDGARGLDAPEKEFTEGATPSAVNQELHRPPTSITGQPTPVGELRTPTTTTPQQPSAGEAGANVKKEFSFSVLDRETRVSKESRETLQKSTQTLRQDLRENSQDLRDNFRENMKTTIGHVDHGKTGRIAVAHGKGLRMVNRFRSAMARFDHILGRMESRVQKLEERGVDMSAVIPLVEEAKNMSVENEARLEELKVKYESLLLGENPGRVAEEARLIAKELKTEIENLQAKLREIATVISGFTTPTYEPEKGFAK